MPSEGSGKRRKMARRSTSKPTQSDRCGFVALIGAPNSGKSTLTNAFVGTKIAIVTHKAKTTRGPVRGIVLVGDSQIILVDTPGIFSQRRSTARCSAPPGTGRSMPTSSRW